MPIHFFDEDVGFKIQEESKIIQWLTLVADKHKHSITTLNYIFCTDEHLLAINREFLDHDYYTDIITFDNAEGPNVLEADVFISIERVKSNALTQEVLFEQELYRVLIHGVLHLLGYKDKTDEEAHLMRQKEDACISLLEEIGST